MRAKKVKIKISKEQIESWELSAQEALEKLSLDKLADNFNIQILPNEQNITNSRRMLNVASVEENFNFNFKNSQNFTNRKLTTCE